MNMTHTHGNWEDCLTKWARVQLHASTARRASSSKPSRRFIAWSRSEIHRDGHTSASDSN